MKKKQAVSDEDLVNIAHRYVLEAEYFLEEEISDDRATALNYYNGENPDGLPLEEGRSRVIDNATRDTILSVLPSLIKIFNSGDKVVSIEGQTEEDKDSADTAEAWINYVTQRVNQGFINDYTWFFDALLQRTGWEQIYWEVNEEKEDVVFEGLNEQEIESLEIDDTFDVKKVTQTGEAPFPSPEGETLLPIFDVEGVETKIEAKLIEEVLPPEEVLYLSDAGPDRKSWWFVAHKCQKRISELREAGYDVEDDIHGPEIDSASISSEYIARQSDRSDWQHDGDGSQVSSIDPSSRKVWYYKTYFRIDLNGDGLAEWMQICFVGDTLLEKEQVDEPYMYCISPILRSHRLTGYSLFDITKQYHELMTSFHRQVLDNMYLTNNPRAELVEDGMTEHTVDDFLDNSAGGYVRVKKPGTVLPLNVSGLQPWTLPYAEMWEGKKEVATGVTRYNQGLDANSLNKTASGIAQIFQAAMQRIELIARVFAETGVRDKIRGLLNLSTKYPDYVGEMTVLLGEKKWNITAEAIEGKYDLVINPALGTGNKDQMLMHLQSLMQDYMALAQAGLGPGSEQALYTVKNLHKAIAEKIKNMGYRNVSDFILDPDNPEAERDPVKQPEQDPKVALDQQKAETDAKEAQGKLELDREKMEKEFQIKQQELQIKQQELRLKEMSLGQELAAIKMGQKIGPESEDIRGGGGQLSDDEIALRSRELDIKEREVDAKIRQSRQGAQPGQDGDIAEMAGMLAEVAEKLQAMAGPKKVERDGSGKIVSINGQSVSRDEMGRIQEIGGE